MIDIKKQKEKNTKDAIRRATKGKVKGGQGFVSSCIPATHNDRKNRGKLFQG